MTIGAVSAADNATQNDPIASINSPSDTPVDDSLNENHFKTLSENNVDAITKTEDFPELSNANESNDSYDNKYYLFRGDCWTIANNFESSASITSETLTDLTVTGTFRTENDIIGLYWNSKDPIQHPYISYGNHSDYCDVILEFDYEMTGCMDFKNSAVNIEIATNPGETYYLTMNRFIDRGHVKLDFNNLTLLPGNVYYDKNGKPITVSEVTKLNTTDLKYVKLILLPVNYVADFSKFTIMNNTDFTCRIYNISVANGEICSEQTPLEPHQYRLCEGYDDVYNLNPFRLSKEMKKLGYAEWVDLYVGASYFYEKKGNIGDVITDMNFDQNRTEKMVLDENVPLNNAFKAWLDCYSRELKNNGVENLIISVSMENLQCPQSWRQMDANGNYAMTGWMPSTFLYSPCNDDAIAYVQNVSKSCLDIVANNGLKPILQMGETWWWWNEMDWQNLPPCFYDNSTKAKYYAETGKQLPVYSTATLAEYDKNVTYWLNQQLVGYSDALREVVESNYDDGLYMALFFTPSVIDEDRVPQMMMDVNFIKDAYSPSKLDVLQIEDYDWVIYENPHHNEAYTIGHELGFDESGQHYFGGFVQYHEDAGKYWPLIQKSMEDTLAKGFKEVFVWAGTQVRRDNKILGYDEYVILQNLLLTNEPGIVSPIITAPDYVSIGENFTVKMRTDEWVNGVFNVYEYKDGEKGKLLASNKITNGSSSVILSSAILGLNKFYLDFDYMNGGYHLIQDVYIIENSKNITVDVSREVETGSDADITFNAPKNSSKYAYVSVDENTPDSYLVENGEFTTAISNLSDGYHTIVVNYNDGIIVDDKLVGEVFYHAFTVKVGAKSIIETSDVNAKYNSSQNLVVNLTDRKGNALSGREILITLNGMNHTLITGNDGKAVLEINLLAGNYSADISYAGDDVYLSSSAKANVFVSRLASKLQAPDISTTYNIAKNLIITLKDENNNILAGKNITISLNNKIYHRTTNENGKATVNVNLPAKKYNAKITFTGDDIYKSSSHTAKVVVKKATPKLSASSKTFKIKAKTKKVTAILKSNKNKAIKNTLVKLTVNKKTYKAKTNSKGVATFKVKLTKKGKYNAVYKYAGNSNYKSTSKKIKITIK
jgi:hypothetical protein